MSEPYTKDCYMARRLRSRHPERWGKDGYIERKTVGATSKQAARATAQEAMLDLVNELQGAA